MVTGVNHHGPVINPLFLQRLNYPAEIGVQGIAAAQIIRIEFLPIPFPGLQVRRRHKVPKPFLTALRPLIVPPVILMMGLNMGNHEEKRFFTVILLYIADRMVGQTVSPVSCEFQFIAILVIHITAVSMGGKFQHIRRHPVVIISAPAFRGNRYGFIVVPILIRSQMPFSHISHPVPPLFQVTGQGFLPQRKGDRVAVAAGLGRIQPGLEHGPGRAAHRLWCERIGKIHRVLTCEPVQTR